MHAVSSNSCSVLRLARGTGPTRSNIRAATSFKFRFSPALCASPKIGRTCSVVSGQPFSAVNEVATVQRAVSCSSSFLGERKILQRSRMVSPKASNAHVRPLSLRVAGDSLPSLERMSQLRDLFNIFISRIMDAIKMQNPLSVLLKWARRILLSRRSFLSWP
jgi:hypothetical protein